MQSFLEGEYLKESLIKESTCCYSEGFDVLKRCPKLSEGTHSFLKRDEILWLCLRITKRSKITRKGQNKKKGKCQLFYRQF